MVEGAGRDLLSIYPPETQVIRQFFVKTEAIEGGDGVLAGIIFANDALPEVIKFFDDKTNPLFQQGRKDGWLTGKWRTNYYRGELFRGSELGPPPKLLKGQGIAYGTHGLGIPFAEWATLFGSPDIAAFHDSCGIIASSAGPSIDRHESQRGCWRDPRDRHIQEREKV